METITEQGLETSRGSLPPFTLPYTFNRHHWWNRSVRQETVVEMGLALVTLLMVGGMLWGFFRALNQWQLGV
ncbi:MAG: hypothetical protein HOP18_07655 [Deltaproteobacteria bacterium]|nr:hypothetical protein [Deltaproteobacteria bacterium]